MADALHPPESAAPVPQTSSGTSKLTAIVVAVIIVTALYFGRDVLIPITLALLLAFLLSPVVEFLRRIWLGRIPSVIIAVVLALGVIIALGSAIGTQVAQLSRDVPQYQATIEHKINALRASTIKRFSSKIESLSHQFVGAGGTRPAASPTPAAGAGSGTPAQKPLPVVVTQPAPSALEIGEKIVSPMLHPLATGGIILVVTIFTLLQKEDLRDRAIRLFGASDLHRTTAAMDEAGRRLSRYFLIQLGINTGFGAIIATGLYFIGVPNPVLWGILGTLLRFIPYIGSWIAAALPIVLAAAVSPGWAMAIWTAALYVVTELTIGQLVEPLVYGHSTGLSPIAVVIAAIFWTWMWGPIGLIISTPLTLCLVVLGRHVEPLEFLDVLLGDRPALTPVESFYQRMLAGDPDEAEEQAEIYLAERPLSSYYDAVALKALQLATADIARGILAHGQIERLKTSVEELVRDLAKYDDHGAADAKEEQTAAGPAVAQEVLDKDRLAREWRGGAPILCIAGRGPLDEAAARMLVQLLEKHGLGARSVPHESVSRTNIGALDVGGVMMACVSYLDISGNPAHLRYLLRRLRERLPQAPLVVGLWPEQEPILRDQGLRRVVGADYYVSTLRAAVEVCLDAARHAATPKPRLVIATDEPGLAEAGP
jgi:predicted PurR-regulated permease PerM